RAIGGSTNFSWRGFYVQANNAVIVEGAAAIAPFKAAFEQYWSSSSAAAFGSSGSAELQDLGLPGIDGKVTFSPHGASNALLAKIALDMEQGTTSSMFYSLAFLFQTPGVIQNAIRSVMANDDIFIYGISDRKVGGLELVKPDGNIAPMRPSALTGKNAPSPFKEEPKGGGGTRMHHKFVVIDFDKPTARVYLGSYNFSVPADTKNGENLFVFRDRRIATSYTVEALRIFDHYHFRVAREEARKKGGTLSLQRPPRAAGETAWFAEDYAKPRKIKDRELFS
ncbi:MAG TPA: phospholipase D-like domain-containing protein, partial [Sphingomicrobium sp.]